MLFSTAECTAITLLIRLFQEKSESYNPSLSHVKKSMDKINGVTSQGHTRTASSSQQNGCIFVSQDGRFSLMVSGMVE